MNRRDFLNALAALPTLSVPRMVYPKPERFARAKGTRIGLVDVDGRVVAAQKREPLSVWDDVTGSFYFPDHGDEVAFPPEWICCPEGTAVDRIVVSADLGPRTVREVVPIVPVAVNGGVLTLIFTQGIVRVDGVDDWYRAGLAIHNQPPVRRHIMDRAQPGDTFTWLYRDS